MRIITLVLISSIPVMLSGCVASKIISAPFKAAGTVVETAVDATTQSQSEKEEDVGRKVLAERKAQRKLCLDDARNKQERKDCKERYSDDY
ncbi:DUF6726 family protein [Parasphingorhabdus halotolerans]|uniref:Lipoprotein n=1 Tax=Parasphingorhabdus halotolerans TaxID=2725558 RepID=A0A6H2DPF5_9SPHN|nr:DUF6726 family protein [Parasphingorhabdus halotolerans]QJB70078.1 hypothetical protein HF685_12930 [Parasphingorhabdus halotolerans]